MAEAAHLLVRSENEKRKQEEIEGIDGSIMALGPMMNYNDEVIRMTKEYLHTFGHPEDGKKSARMRKIWNAM